MRILLILLFTSIASLSLFSQNEYFEFSIENKIAMNQLEGLDIADKIRVVHQTQQAISFQTFFPQIVDEPHLVFFGKDTNNYFTQKVWDHALVQYKFSGLEPATPYYIRTSNSSKWESVITASMSSGDIEVYFTTSVDESYAQNGQLPNVGGQLLENKVIDLINSAQSTIDFCAYNNTMKSVVDALKTAKARGVRVRYITDNTTSNSALVNLNFPVIKVNQDRGLMHNKFIIVDAESVNESYLMMGSTNFTSYGFYNSDNNMILIQDQALAIGYRMEFEEMWGSSLEQPNQNISRSGNTKTDNTPHQYTINNIPVQSYFSPSDGTTDKIINTLETIDHSCYISLLTFTKNEPSYVLVRKNDEKKDVRVLINNVSDNGSEFVYLFQQGVDVREHFLSKQLHHKYAIIDAFAPDSDPMVLTGSHNWTSAAEFNNDENTLIFHDAIIADMFAQEFAARYCELNPPSCALTSNQPQFFADIKLSVFPNPTTDFITISSDQLASLNIHGVVLSDMNGRTIFMNRRSNDQYRIDLSSLPDGVYVVSVYSDKGRYNQQVIKHSK